MGFVACIVVGLIAGSLAGQVMKGGGYGLVVDIILGILGGLVGGWIFGLLGIWQGGGMIGSIGDSADPATQPRGGYASLLHQDGERRRQSRDAETRNRLK